MCQAEIVAYTASESLAFGAQMHQVQKRLKNLNFNCRWSKKIVDVSQSNAKNECFATFELSYNVRSHSIAILIKTIRTIIMEVSQRKQTPVLVIDEANLLRLEVFSQLQTIGQFEMDSKRILPIILSGQNNLIDKLMYHTSCSLSSRMVGKSHLGGLKQKDIAGYLKHHLEIAGISERLFSDEAVLAIHQGSGGLLRRANILARGSLIAAAAEKCQVVSTEII